MATILTKEQSAQIRALTDKQKELDPTFNTFNGWMCEGADEDMIVFFNNSVDGFFHADYFGNIIGYIDFDISDEFKEIIKLEGKKCQIACYGKLLDK